ncbi:MAG: hypothetical protein ABFD89_02195 [Bryobacteraceae bacterium]
MRRPTFALLAVAVGFGGILFLPDPSSTNAQQLRSFKAERTDAAGLAIANVSAPSQVAAYERFEITFDVTNTVAGNYQFPYDPSPPPGVDPHDETYRGISVDAVFTQDDWKTVYRQPAFFYQQYLDGGMKPGPDGQPQRWLYPAGAGEWKVRFTPHVAGSWKFRLTARDASGTTDTPPRSFNVAVGTKSGFLRVSRKDPRYFEFDNGNVFLSPGLQATQQVQDSPSNTTAEFAELQKNHISLLRIWISNMYGSAWLRWRGRRNIHDGYLPRAGILPVHDSVRSRDLMALSVKYPEDWFDCCYSDAGAAQAVKPDTTYLISVRYRAEGITGPRVQAFPGYGLVAKILGRGATSCSEPGSGEVVTTYGGNAPDWVTIQGMWYSESNDYLPNLGIGLENVTEGRALVTSISVREVFPNGQLGPEVSEEPSMEYELYFPDRALRAMDEYVELAEKHGVFLKVVLMEKNDLIYYKLDDNGTFVIGRQDNEDGFYGLGRGLNKTRWLQRAWWRYVTARWGYSTSIHSWELVNEGDPFSTKHWELADEFGKFMHCEVFGVSVKPGDSAQCPCQHPNRHMVTTSFWHSFPGYSRRTGTGFWGNPKYPNLDYADVHAYISTSAAPEPAKSAMESDAAYYHLWHSKQYGSWKLNTPVIRGEAGMVPRQGSTNDFAGLGLQRDVRGIWYHNFLWASLDSGALYEIYWYTVPHVYSPGTYNHAAVALSLHNFLDGVPLNNGHYQDASAATSTPGLRVVGQKDLVNSRTHLWIQNKAHTWKTVVDSVTVAAISGNIRIGGFAPGRLHRLDWWDTYRTTGQVTSTTSIRSGADGILTIPVQNLATDVAVKITPDVIPSRPTK